METNKQESTKSKITPQHYHKVANNYYKYLCETNNYLGLL